VKGPRGEHCRSRPAFPSCTATRAAGARRPIASPTARRSISNRRPTGRSTSRSASPPERGSSAHLGRLDEAIALGEDAVDVVQRGTWLNDQARVWLALSEVQFASGSTSASDVAIQKALELYKKKGNLAAADRLRAAHPGLE
jgi:hypothetical protein